MGKLTALAITFVLALLAAGCGQGAGATAAPAASSGPAAASSGPAATAAASSKGAVVSGSFKSGQAQLTLSGASSAKLALPFLANTFGAPGAAGMGPGYKWYEDSGGLVAVTIRFPGDPVSTGTTAFLPKGTGMQVEFDLITSAGDLFSSSNGECTVTITQNDASGLKGRLDCHGVPGSSDPAKTIDATGTFEAQP